MEIIRCTKDEQIKELAALANEIWHEYFTSIISEEQIDYMVARFQSYPALCRAIRQEGYVYFLAYEGERLIGYCGVKPEEERLFLSKLYLQKSYRGKHLSGKLLREACRLAEELKKKAVYLTCNKYNTHSLMIYRAKGFYEIDAVQTDIGNGFIMDDYIMQLDL